MNIATNLVDFKSKNQYKDWLDIINLGVDLLVKNNKATKGLANAILETTKEYGVYYIITPKLALLHAAPSNYCLEAALSLMVLEEEVEFGFNEKKPASIIFTLSAPNGESHINLIQELMIFLQEDGIINRLEKCKSKKEILDLLKEKKGGV